MMFLFNSPKFKPEGNRLNIAAFKRIDLDKWEETQRQHPWGLKRGR